MKRLMILVTVLMAFMLFVGSAMADDFTNFNNLISSSQLNQEPDFSIDAGGVQLDKRLIGQFYGESSQKVAVSVKVDKDGKISVLCAWDAGFEYGHGIEYFKNGKVSADGSQILTRYATLKIEADGTLKHIYNGPNVNGYTVLIATKMKPVDVSADNATAATSK